MSVFISYSRKDREFVDRLADELLKRDIKVWKDSWRILVGDSLEQKIDRGLENARFFCVVWSQNSRASKWVKREIKTALMRKIEQRQVTILPILLDDAKLPRSLRDKLYADFRGDFDKSLKALLAIVLPYYSTTHSGRVTSDDHYFKDHSCVTEIVDGRPVCEIDIVSHDREESYSILTQFRFEGTEHATLEALHLDEPPEVTDLILRCCVDEFAEKRGYLPITPGKKATKNFTLNNASGELLFKAFLTVKILGDKRKGVVVYNVGALFS